MAKDNIESILPLSPMQEGILFHCIAEPGDPVYVEQLACCLKGALDTQAFKSAWERVVARHEVLRTLFTWERRDRPLQIVRAQVTIPWIEEDWTALDPDAQGMRWQRMIESQRERNFQLTQAPLLRFVLVRTAVNEHRFLFSFHHLVLDGWSTRIVIDEVFQLYREGGAARNTALPATRPYRDYVVWQLEQDHAQAEVFWRQRLQGFVNLQPLRWLKTRAPQRGGNQRLFTADTELTQRLRDLARGAQVTLNTVVFGAWSVLLSRYSADNDVTTGVTVSGRDVPLEGIERSVGLFINSLPMRAQVSEHEAISEWLSQLQAEFSILTKHAHAPLSRIQSWSEHGAGTSLFDSLLVFENMPGQLLSSGGEDLTVDHFQVFEQSHFPLSLVVAPGQALQFYFFYRRNQFDADTVDMIWGHLGTVLEAMAAAPQGTLGDLPWLTEAERNTLLEECNETAACDEPPTLVLEQIREHAVRKPAHPAVIGAGKELSYAALMTQAQQLGERMRSRAVVAGDRVGICTRRSPQAIVAILATLQCGAAYVALDPDQPPHRLAALCKDSQPRLVLAQRELIASLPDEVVSGGIDTLWLSEPDEHVRPCAPVHVCAVAIEPATLAYVMYTSGSTGSPKGVMVSHRNLACSTAARAAYYPESPARFLLLPSLAFDSSVAGLFWTLCAGGTLILPAPGEEKDPWALAALIAEQRITHLLTLPSVHAALLDAGNETQLASLRNVMVAGEACPATLPREHYAMLPDTTLYNEYGPTEGCVWCSVYPTSPTDTEARVPIGRAIPGTRLYVLDEQRHLVPVGIPGEIYIAGAGVAQGYLGNDLLTEERFVPDPFSAQLDERLYRTGDRGRFRPDGNIEFLGRRDDQLKIRGQRVEPGEVEAALRTVTGVEAAAVIGFSPQPSPEDDAALVQRLMCLEDSQAELLLRRVENASEPPSMGSGEDEQ